MRPDGPCGVQDLLGLGVLIAEDVGRKWWEVSLQRRVDQTMKG